jgi:hypothetical protein
MALQERSYSGQLFRPRPEIHTDNDRLLILATPWGPRSSAKKAIQVITDHFHATQQDHEATSPFHKLSCLSPLANNLRVAVKMANDLIYNEDNKNEYVSGLELLVIARNQYEMACVQIGMPMVLLDRPYRALTPLCVQSDLATEFSFGSRLLAPLPHQLLGSESSSDFSVFSFRPAEQDRLVLISRSSLPASVYALHAGSRNLDNISQLLANDDSDLPFWAGVLSF